MIQAFILSATYVPSHYSTDTPTRIVEQVIIEPAGRNLLARRISNEHPKARWRVGSYSPAAPWATSGLDRALRKTDWTYRANGAWHLTGAPVGFQMTDEEFLDLRAGRMPRNVALRAQRALAATEQVVIGAGAREDIREFRGCEIPALEGVSGDSVADRLEAHIARLSAAIAERDTLTLAAVTPPEACARGAARLLNAEDIARLVAGDKDPDVAPAPAPVPVPAPASRDGIVKPGETVHAADGQPYVARKVEADNPILSDVQLFRDAAEAGMNVFLFGNPGTGKTRGLQAAFPDAIIVPISGDTEVSDLVGGYQPSGADGFIWVDGPLVRAMEQGRMIVLDEVGLLDPKTAAIVFPLMDGRRELLVTANPLRGTVHAKDGFAIAGTTNPDAPGVRLSEALLSRFHIHMEVTTDYAVMRGLGVDERLVQFAEHLAKQRESGEMEWAPEARELLVAKAHMEKFGTIFAIRNMIASAPYMVREILEQQAAERWGDLPGARRKMKGLKI